MSILNRYYRITRFYGFLKNLSIKSGIILGLLIILFAALEYYFIDANAILNSIAKLFSPWYVVSLFYLSETFIGFLPPEAFIAWSSKMAIPWSFVWILATVSYLGGVTAFYLGRLSYRLSPVKRYIEKKNAKHIENLKRWGGVFVFVGAMLPLPHSLVSFYAGMIQFRAKNYLLWALFRFLRFYIYAHVVFYIL